jgi:hypothetical protein
MFDFIQNKGGRSKINIAKMDEGAAEASVVWNSEKVNKLLHDHENGLIDIKTLKNSPFKDNDPAWKKPNIVWQYSPEEMVELERCKNDILYFAEKYCMIMTENGVMTVPLHDYQEEILTQFEDPTKRFYVWMASRQVGKTWMSSIYIVWYLIFHVDKNALVIADNAATTKEVIDKIKTIFENMPFFLKPGCITNAVMSLKFDNGCRLIGRSTTKKSGIGFNIHLLYIDEFAHIAEAYIDTFFRSIYPTISASKNSKIIITSTPNGMNKFYEIYDTALKGENEFTPLRVDWWQFPGRDDEWKAKTIANLGSEESFNQEYGLQFFASDKLLLNSKELKRIMKLKTSYMPHNFTLDPEIGELMKHLTFHPKMVGMTLDEIKNDPSSYVFSIDTADGMGADFLVCNIYKFVPIPIKMLEQVKHLMKNRFDIFGLVQVGMFRTNQIDINEFCKAMDILTFGIFNPEKVKIVLEMNHKGDYVHEKLKLHPQYNSSLMVLTKHTLQAQFYKPGIALSSMEMKNKICERAKYAIMCFKIIPNEFKTCMELGAYGKSRSGSYRGQSGNDDCALTTVNLSAFFDSPNFWEMADEAFDRLPPEYLKAITERILSSIEGGDGRSSFDLESLRKLNGGSEVRNLGNSTSIFTREGIESYQEILNYFRNT